MDEQRKAVVGKKLTYTVVPGQAGRLSDTYTRDETDKKFNDASRKLVDANEKLVEAIKRIEKIDWTLFAVVLILLVMVATLVIDSFHINSVTYKEYSEKTTSVETTQKVNQELLDQNRENQELIIELQKQLLNR